MTADKIIEQIERFQRDLLTTRGGGVEINNPAELATALVKIRVLLVQLVDKVADIELQYRQAKAKLYEENIKTMKPSPAKDALDFDPEIIALRVENDRLHYYMKHVDSLVGAVQSYLKVLSSSEKNQY